jgi:hypothetical protein
MGTTWVLHTETKGTGATMVPLERVTKRSSAAEPLCIPPKRPAPRKEEPNPRAPRKFKIVDVMTRQNCVLGANAREAMEVLKSVRSVVDVNVYVWDEERRRWLLLPFSEQRAMLRLAHGQRAASA